MVWPITKGCLTSGRFILRTQWQPVNEWQGLYARRGFCYTLCVTDDSLFVRDGGNVNDYEKRTVWRWRTSNDSEAQSPCYNLTLRCGLNCSPSSPAHRLK